MRSPARTRRRPIALSVLLIAGGLMAPPTAGAGPAPAQPEFPAPAVRWEPCADDTANEELRCATVAVPLDYDNPSGPTITLVLNRLATTGLSPRKGTLFLNPGGPGESGVDVVRRMAPKFPAELRAVYDIVGFDPRGVGGSTPLRCFVSEQDAKSVEVTELFPVNAGELADREARQQKYAEACRDNGGPLLDHMSTANVARDLDVLRRALGDPRLNYLGYSYGSYLGETYAALLPHNVGAVVLDGVLDPRAWATGHGNQARRTPYTTRVRSDRASEEALQEFFARCDEAGDRCAFSGDAAARFRSLRQRLAVTPAPFPDFPTIQVDERFLLGATGGMLYTPQNWPFFAEFLAVLESESAADDAAALDGLRSSLRSASGPDPVEVATPDPAHYDQFEAADAVGCSDTDNPSTFTAWSANAERAAERFPNFGRTWAWQSSVCAFWPGRDDDRYSGPFRTRTANPVLVVGNYHDPSTGHDGAVAATKLIENSRLLSYAGWGHKAYLTAGNACVDDAVTRYLVSGTLPAPGTVCRPERSPFDAEPTPIDDSTMQQVPGPVLELLSPG